MNQKDKYRQLCKEENSIPIFSKDWWMDAVCGEDNWDVLLVEKGGQVVASMPIYIKQKYGLKYITQPILTQTNGIWIRYPQIQKYVKKLKYEKEIMNDIIRELEKRDVTLYQQSFNYSVQNWLPFYWKGFEQTTRYTYLLNDLSDLDEIYNQFDIKLRNQIRKAERLVNIQCGLDLESFYNINIKTYNRQNRRIPYTLEALKRIDNACIENNCRNIFYAHDDKGNIHAAIYIVWDKNSSYYLMGGTDPQYMYSEATSLLIWHAIMYSSKIVNKFDFEGSMVESIEKYFRQFGAIQMPYNNISKVFKHKFLISIYKSLKGNSGR